VQGIAALENAEHSWRHFHWDKKDWGFRVDEGAARRMIEAKKAWRTTDLAKYNWRPEETETAGCDRLLFERVGRYKGAKLIDADKANCDAGAGENACWKRHGRI